MLQAFLIAGVALMLTMAAAAAGPEQEPAAERGRIEAEIQGLNSSFAAEEAACKQRFAVSTCVEEVRLKRRETLRPLRSRLLALDDTERRQRASARLAAIDSKRQAQRPSVPEPPAPGPAEPPPAAASAPLVVVRREGTAATRQQAASADAAKRVAAAGQRQRQADADAARVRERLLERERSGKKAAPLPVPAAAP